MFRKAPVAPALIKKTLTDNKPQYTYLTTAKKAPHRMASADPDDDTPMNGLTPQELARTHSTRTCI
ncbi:hypothetical protein PSHT_10062 [Puccinia striiformis]|uniref:Uncharacterized protein n=1 Tax=Puccinia striiformis TaxID=27350 RepID=A0A2S4VCB4_9BASI|nr:hypothetical protein PSHT_10062 [Puccinia striiformis]